MMFRLRRVSRLRLLVNLKVGPGLPQVQVMQAIQVQKLRPRRLTQGIIRSHESACHRAILAGPAQDGALPVRAPSCAGPTRK